MYENPQYKKRWMHFKNPEINFKLLKWEKKNTKKGEVYIYEKYWVNKDRKTERE